MPVLLLALVSLLLCIGLLLLPPLTGGGIGSLFARAWLFFGILVFSAHYVYFLKKTGGRQVAGSTEFTVRRRGEQLPVQSREYT